MPRCVVCKEEYEDLFTHLTGKKSGFLDGLDEDHDAYLASIQNSRKGRFYTTPCFCGNQIVSSGSSSNGTVSWEDACEICGFLYDED